MNYGDGRHNEVHKQDKLLFYNMLPGSSDGKESACNAGDLGSIPGLGRAHGEGNGKPSQYSCQGNPMDRGAWWAAVHGVAKNWTRLSDSHSNYLTLMCLWQAE